MDYETTFSGDITASEAIEANMLTYTRYSNSEVLPSCIDGLKLVHRRIIGVLGTNDTRMKGATLTGEVMNKLHPHGDSGIYDASVRLGQPFSQVHPFITIKGNFGAYGGGEYAASRYLDVQSAPFTKDIFFNNVDLKTLTYIPSETGAGVEPAYYIPRIPTTLLMGAFAVSVAYKAVVPQFNFTSVCNLVEKYIELRSKYPTAYKDKYAELAEYCIPDFPTHCLIRNKKQILSCCSTGNFNHTVLSDGIVELSPTDINLRTIPYGSKFEDVFKRVGNMMNSANFISANFTEINDLTTGTEYGNIQFKLKRGANPFEILDEFKKQVTFTQKRSPIWTFVDKDGYVVNMNPIELVDVWYLARHRSILGALKFQNIDLFKQYRKLTALIIIADHTDEVLKIFKQAENRAATIPVLTKRFKLTREQAEYIATLQLHQITHQGKDDLLKSLESIKDRIHKLQEKFVNIDAIILEDIAYLKKTYGPVCPRRSKLPEFIGAIHIVALDGYIQFTSYHELVQLMRRWGKQQQVHIIMYPHGIYNLVVHTHNKTIVTDEQFDLPREFYAVRLEVIKHKPRATVSLREGCIARIDNLVQFDKKTRIGAHVATGFTAIDRAFKMHQYSTTAITKRLRVDATGVKSDIQYFNGVQADEVVIAVVNNKNPNQVDLQRLKEGEIYRKPLLGSTRIIGMWKYGNPISLTIPQEFLNRCSIKTLLIKNPDSFFGTDKKITVHMNKQRTSTNKNLVPLYKGVDVLSDSAIKGGKHHE